MSNPGRTPRPVPFQGDLSKLPDALAALKELPNWVCWRWEWRVDKKGVGKWTKPPLQPKNPTSHARNNDPATWGTYAEALAAFETGKCDGIGFNLSGTDIAAFDIDKCRDPATGGNAPEATAIVNRATSYTEMTVSGTGLRVIGYGSGLKMHRKQKLRSSPVEVESYRNAERYIVITGNPLPGTWPHIADIDDVIDAVVAEIDGCKDGVLDDEFAFKPQVVNGDAGDTGDAFLPSNLIELIEKGVPPQDDLSAAFHHAVCWLADCGWSADRIEARIAGKPIVPERFAHRLGQEIARCLHKRKIKAEAAGDADLDALIDGGRKKWNKPDIEQATPVWREKRTNGCPIPSMHNARLAVTAIGVECSFDTFHNKMLFGYKDDTTRHVVQPILGEVSDDGILGLRRLLSDHFGFDLTDKHVRDAVKSLALEHCFDPVADMLDEAEANWDGVKRLDRMASDYLNCEDTSLNTACVRKTMIAAVARERNPGCKFDTILVLESPEGFNKSSAWQLLAGEENFSDEKIIGKESREVQEQLSTIWIHENADLAGMKKAEVETVKAFASRTSDRARPAYGYFQKNQPRHSIEVGTTNSDEYLQSQTGNRRFWPMLVLRAIDLEKLKKDRLQLWGEAAHCQSKGESLTLDKSMWPDAGAEQENRRVKDPWEAVLANVPEVVEKKRWDEENERYISTSVHKIIRLSGDQERVASSDLLTYVLEVPLAHQTTADMMRLSNVMKVLGWERTSNKITINGQQVRGFFRRIEPGNEGNTGQSNDALTTGAGAFPNNQPT